MSEEKSKFDEGYDKGYEAGKNEMPVLKLLQERLHYFQVGGRFGCEPGVERDADSYIDGFRDAMKTLGVKP